MKLTQPLHKGLSERPKATALVCGGERLDFVRLVERVSRLAGGLQALGLRAGDRVGMIGLNSHRFVEYFYGVWWGGGVINPVNVRWSAQEVAYSLDDCNTRILLADDAFKGLALELRERSKSLRTLIYVGDGAVPEGMSSYEALLERAEPAADALRGGDDLAAVMYTGGTTGLPKGVMLTHSGLALNALSQLAAVARPPGAVALLSAPMFHVGGMALSLQAMLRLGTQILLPAFDEVATLEAIHRERVTETFLVPTMIKRLIEHPRFGDYDLSSLRMMIYGAAPIDSTLLAQAMRALPNSQFCQAYGMTELCSTAAVLPPDCHLPGSDPARLRAAGLPVPVAEIRIVDAQDRELPRGAVGEITVRGPTVMAGYWNKPEQTAAALRGGWMHTGDSGYMNSDGFVYVVDRIKDMIVSGGENVYSAEVENAISQLPEVSACAVIGVPDDAWGERVHAVVVPRAGMALTEAAVVAHCRSLIAGYKCPRSVEFRTELPLSAAGKLQKFKLREPFWEGRERRIA